MSYSDQKYYARNHYREGSALSFGTATAGSSTGHNVTDVANMKKFVRRSQVTGARLHVTTIPNAASTNLVASFVNGTNTFGTAVLTTAALDSYIDLVITTASNGIFAAGDELKINITGTATASGAAVGAFDVWIEQNELFA
jgi:hypothetical protein